MTIPIPELIKNLRKRPPSHAGAYHHLMLAGISQTMFIQNWGEPEIHISLKRLGGFLGGKSLYLVVNSDNDADFSILIYRKIGSVLFFTKKKLVTHFRWSGFEERYSKLEGELSKNSTRVSLSLIA